MIETLDDDGAKVARYSRIGLALIGAALAAPFVLASLGWFSASVAARSTASAFGVLMLLALVSWMLTRKRSPLTAAKARIVVGVLLACAVWSSVLDSLALERGVKQFLRDALQFQAQQTAKFEALGKRFDAIDVSVHVKPEVLASKEKLLAAQSTLESYRALLEERRQLVQSFQDESTAFINALPLDVGREQARAGMESHRTPLVEMYRSLDQAQSAYVVALAELFRWALANNGKFSLRGGQLLFPSNVLLDEFRVLAQRTEETAAAVDATVEAARQTQTKLMAQHAADRQKIQAALEK
jgi:hypothetical protein